MGQTFLGRYLSARRSEKGISQRALADMVGIDHTYISKIEQGAVDTASADLLHRLAVALDANEDTLMDYARIMPPGLIEQFHLYPSLGNLLRAIGGGPIPPHVIDQCIAIIQSTRIEA